MTWDRRKNAAGLNMFMRSQPSPYTSSQCRNPHIYKPQLFLASNLFEQRIYFVGKSQIYSPLKLQHLKGLFLPLTRRYTIMFHILLQDIVH